MSQTRFIEGDGTISRARDLRRDATTPERRLWAILRGRNVGDAKFRRQQRNGPFFADFVCQSARLLVEVDGESHSGDAAERDDRRRTAYLEQEGYRVLRFTNTDVMQHLDAVSSAILAALAPSPSHPAMPGGPLPLPHGEMSA